MINNNEYQTIILEAAKKAGEIHKKYFRTDHFHVTAKDNRQRLLTEADTESQKLIRDYLHGQMLELGHREGEIGFIGEEELYQPAEYTFIIDPIDGTTNFAYGFDYFSVSIALYKDHKPLIGCIYAPIYDTTYVAIEGQGAEKIERQTTTPLHIHETSLSDSLFALPETSVVAERHWRFMIHERMQAVLQASRNFGSTALDFCLLADNRFHVVANGAQSWDFAAADIIVRAAGGITVDWDGNPFIIDTDHYKQRHYLLASHPAHIQQFVEIIQSAKA